MKTTLEFVANHRQMLDNELKQFVEKYKGNNFPAIKALASKIEHMCLYIGCPASVFPMLTSICNNQIKKWSTEPNGKQLGLASLKDIKNGTKFDHVIMGHFRWDHGKAYILSNQDIAYIKNFYFKGDILTPSLDAESEYEMNAVEFIKKHNIGFTIKLLKRGKYFSDDKQERNIYEITLTRKGLEYVFTFGQSVVGTEKGETPSVYDVLACLTKYDVGTFEDFCSEFGYEEDSRTAEKTYHAVVDEFKNVERLMGDIMDELQEIQ